MVALHKATPRSVEFASREKSGRQEEKACLRAAASRDKNTPTGRALKRVRFEADRVGDDAEAPEETSASAPSSLPAEAASSNSLPAPGPSASATDSLDQVMSEGASSAPDAAVRLSMKRPSDGPIPCLRQKRLRIDHSMRDVVMLLDDSDVSRSIERCREVCRRVRRFLSM